MSRLSTSISPASSSSRSTREKYSGVSDRREAIVTFLIRLGAKLRLSKHPEETIVRVSAGLDVYHASILRLAKLFF